MQGSCGCGMGRVFSDLINNYNGFFVTGTDTDVGKTYFSALLLSFTKGLYYKPFQTGDKDSKTVKEFTKLGEAHFAPEAYYFKDPVSPHVAFEKYEITVNLDKITPPVSSKYKIITEGAGGVYTPIKKEYFIIDVIVKFGFPAVVVTNDKLGCINHTILTVQEIRRRGVWVPFVVLNNFKSESYNLRTIRDILQIPVMGVPKFTEFPDRKTLKELFDAEV